MPEQAGGDPTNSIDAVWPPVASIHERIRGFYDGDVIRTAVDILQFEESLEAGLASLDYNPESDRLSLRLIASAEALRLLNDSGLRLEAAVPFSRDGEELALTYMGLNPAHRRISGGYLTQHMAVMNQVESTRRESLNPLQEFEASRFELNVIDADSTLEERAALVDRFLELYKVFGYDKPFVSQLLGNPTNTIAYLKDGEAIAATLMAERATVTVQGLGPVNLVEITEGVAWPRYRGRGLFKNLYRYLLDRVLEGAGNNGNDAIDTLYSEHNLAMRGLMIAGQKIGMHYSYFDAPRFGLSRMDFGIIPQSFPVNDRVETRPYNDFAIAYVPLDDL